MSMTDNPVISIVGAGLMGHGIAQRFLAAGLKVNLYDPSKAALANARAQIQKIYDILCQQDTSGELLTCTTSMTEAASHADLVIEAGPENKDIKRDIFSELCTFAPYNLFAFRLVPPRLRPLGGAAVSATCAVALSGVTLGFGL